MTLYGRLERVHAFLVPTNPLLLTAAGILHAQNLCNMPELQSDQYIKREIFPFSTNLFTEIVKKIISLSVA